MRRLGKRGVAAIVGRAGALALMALLAGGAQAQSAPPAAPASPAPPSAAAPAPAFTPAIANPTAAARALGVDVARLINSEAMTRVQTGNAIRVALPRALADNGDFKLLENGYPGITSAVVAAMAPELEDMVVRRLPVAWERLGAVYAGTFTEGELRELLAFYRSPTGQWLTQAVANGSDLTQLLKRQIADPGARLTAQDLRTGITEPGIKLALKTATPERSADLVRLGVSPIGRKLATINPQLAEVAARWSNEKIPGQDKRIEEITVATMREFIAKADAAKGKAPKS